MMRKKEKPDRAAANRGRRMGEDPLMVRASGLRAEAEAKMLIMYHFVERVASYALDDDGALTVELIGIASM